jgi:chemotaxis protein CheC
MDDIRDLKALQLDALREVENIGAGHAATALSQMTNRRIMITVPTVTVARLEEVAGILGKPDELVAGILLHMLGDLTGRTLLVFPEAAARRLCDLLLARPIGRTTEFGALEQSSLKECGNILCGAYMNALSSFMGMMLVPSVPNLVIDLAAAVLNASFIDFGRDRDFVFCVETQFQFRVEQEGLTGYFLLMPDMVSLRAILQAIRLT